MSSLDDRALQEQSNCAKVDQVILNGSSTQNTNATKNKSKKLYSSE